MGKNSKRISKRNNHAGKIKEGYCLICNEYGVLSKDHVPPKGSISITKIEQKHIGELMGQEAANIKGVRASNGSTFKTICSTCNGDVLGKCDSEISRVYKYLTPLISSYFNGPILTPSTLCVDFDAIKYARGMVGHILSATSVNECKNELQDSPYFTPLRKFVLGDDEAINNSHDIYYWFYPKRMHLSAKHVGFFNEGNLVSLSLLSFFPVAFLIAQKGKGVHPQYARKLNLTDKKINLDLSVYNSKHVDFPFIELQGNRMLAISDGQCIVSYPVK